MAISSSMKELNPKSVTLNNVKANERGVTDLFENLTDDIESIDVSSSSIGKKSLYKLYEWMKKLFRNDTLKLKHLNLSNNQISDAVASEFIWNLKLIDVDLEKLDLSKNMLSEETSQQIADFLELTHTLKTLNLSWNRINDRAAIPLLQAMLKSHTIRNLNLSYNRLGKSNSMDIIEAIAKVVNEGTIKHLDLSYNNFNAAQ